jgi:hypothetical protein
LNIIAIGCGRLQSISAGWLPAGGGGVVVCRIASWFAGLRMAAGPRFRTQVYIINLFRWLHRMWNPAAASSAFLAPIQEINRQGAKSAKEMAHSGKNRGDFPTLLKESWHSLLGG